MINDWSTSKQSFNGIVLIILTMFMAFWLSACSVTPATSTAPPSSSDSASLVETADPLTYQACAYPPNELVQGCNTKGGTFLQQGRLGCYQCVLSYTDAGKVCQDGSDCQGQCKNTGEFIDSHANNQKGQCASDSSVFGCYQTIEKGVAQPAICVD
ncbi:hypothetical protein FHS24_000406 [Psychrobacter luti]|uniref:Uncharacterized protein n=1 Tax=Psychrobacter luti TaxID=198481 RepID=A0A839TCY5_9GAMM|nr:hypothetical protein [Psychrobacter luti]MBB3105915.1 hypothetical protein [Psychrobacter luti]